MCVYDLPADSCWAVNETELQATVREREGGRERNAASVGPSVRAEFSPWDREKRRVGRSVGPRRVFAVGFEY